MRALDTDALWIALDHRGWVHPYDENGRRRSVRDIPKPVIELKDDPFRSLAGELRRIAGFAKDITPFSEFLWADFLRRCMKRKLVETHFRSAITQAMKLAKIQEAHYHPGWCGPSEG